MISDTSPPHTRARIVFVIDTLTAGGTERHLLRLVAGLLRSGDWDVTVYCLSRTGAFVQVMEDLGVTVVGPSAAMHMSPRWLARMALDLYRYFRRERPALAHCYLTASGLLGSIAARLAGVPAVVTTRRNVYNFTGGKQVLHRVSMGMTSFLSDAIIAVCGAARLQGIAEGTSPKKIITIYNSIPLRHFPQTRLGRFSGQPVIGTLAELHTRKGLPYLVDAVPHILASAADARVVIAGKGPERAALERQISALGLEGRVELLGEVLDIETFLPELDIFVLPSIREGMPNALMEAMLAGVPVVATRVGGVPEIVHHEETGLLVDSRSPGELAEAILHLWRDPQLRRQYAAAARTYVLTTFGDVRREVSETEAVYRALLRSGRTRFGGRELETAT